MCVVNVSLLLSDFFYTMLLWRSSVPLHRREKVVETLRQGYAGDEEKLQQVVGQVCSYVRISVTVATWPEI